VTPPATLIKVVTRLGIAVLTIAMLAVPTMSYRYVRQRVQLGAQQPAPRLAPLAPALEREFTAAARGPAAFVVLGYHDLVPNLPRADAHALDGRRVSIRVASFVAQLRMLRLAGYQSVTAAEVADFVNVHGTLPRRAVLIAFDGARWRDWSYADPALAAYGFRATIFIDPATVRSRRGVSLSWLALRALVKTGRWSVGVAGTQTSVPISAGGTRGSALLYRQWLPAAGRAETTAEFQERIGTILDRQRHAIVEQGLPDPRLFSYPFQPLYPLNTADLADLTKTMTVSFAGALLSLAQDESVDPAWAARRVLPRMEVYSGTTDEMLFNRIQNLATS
jgi:biofilm PGA synthesis lipoprotein PgaB